MERQQGLNKLRNKISYASGRRKILAMAELVLMLAPYEASEAQSIAADAVKRARDLLDKTTGASTKIRQYESMLALALFARASSQKLSGVPLDEPKDLLEAARIFEENDDPNYLLLTLEELGQLHRQFGRLDEASQAIDRALHIANVLMLDSVKLRLLCARAAIAVRRGNYTPAEELHAEAYELLPACKDSEELALAHLALAEPLYMARRYTDAVEHYHKSREFAAQDADRRTQTVACWQLAFCYLFLGNLSRQVEFLLAGLEQARLGGMAWVEAGYCVELGNRSLYGGDFANSVDFLQRAESVYDQLGDVLSQSVVYGDLGVTFMEFNDVERGHAALRRSVHKMLTVEPLPKNMVTLVRMLGYGCWDEAEYHELLEYLNGALKLAPRFTRTAFLAQTYLALAIVNQKLRRHTEAVGLVAEALKVARKLKLEYVLVNALHIQAELLHTINDISGAVLVMQEAEVLCRKKNLEGHLRTHYELMQQIYSDAGEFQKALDCTKKLKKFDQERYSRRNNDIVARAIRKREFERLRQERDDALRQDGTHMAQLEQTKRQLMDSKAILEQLQLLLPAWRAGLRKVGDSANEKASTIAKAISIEMDEIFAEMTKVAKIPRYDQADRDFVEKLAAAAPTLSETERKVCVLIKNGMGSKEICRLLHVSPRTVETYRYRIRRKLDLDSKSDLASCLHDLT